MSNPLTPKQRIARDNLPADLERVLLPAPVFITPDDLEGALFCSDLNNPEDANPRHPKERYDMGNKLLCDGLNNILEKCRNFLYTNTQAEKDLRALLDSADKAGLSEVWDTMSRDIIHEVFEQALRLPDLTGGVIFQWSPEIWKQRLSPNE